MLTTHGFNENENFEEAVMATMTSEFLGEFHSNLKIAVWRDLLTNYVVQQLSALTDSIDHYILYTCWLS